jgi:hypothetical protein
VFKEDWYSRPFWGGLDRLKLKYESVAGPSWPSFDKFLFDDFDGVEPKIKKEILDDARWQWSAHFKITARSDLHPTPIEHLEYIDAVLSEFDISEDTRAWVQEIDNKLRTTGTHKSYENLWKPVIIKRW